MRNVYPANVEPAAGEPISCRERGEERLGARREDEEEAEEEGKKRSAPAVFLHRRRIELRFLSNSEDRTNLKGTGGRG